MAPPTSPSGDNLMKRAGLIRRIKLFFQAWIVKISLASMFKIMRITGATKLKPTLPEYTKRYPVRPMLEHRVFLPPDHVQKQRQGEKLPLLISIHGGGFMVCDPQVDDTINRHFASRHGLLVISINYRLAPRNPFPDSVHDVAESIRAILASPPHPYDASRVSIMGFSAGGNLTLSVAQLPDIKEKVQSLVAFYPVVDFSGKYKGKYKTTKDGKPDMLKNVAPIFNWAYIPPGQDKTDPLLSPIYAANREKLPQRVFFIAAEYDYLEHEANAMAKMLAGVETSNEELGVEWERNGVNWRTVPNVIHSWTHIELKGDEEVQRLKGLDALYQDVADWLLT
ncbi:uncharacterized protein A1O9_10939 [Exophiala aquamarina CBS 119918]|uniref:Alpha/beta hydrolase fold-3 domain-containing protein n=1 Tax=Exophiala aquamarina CBS 119918 TaxID=1182545 RepID=A0A072NZH8_9EURO|nr:uncharacterized protein A1O9_10939 [Exophiala aquamarina CBS 119918]KEF53031.1 hypothetical protein A1O9_10939 [Exophiala aquamarina CBS 119918]